MAKTISATQLKGQWFKNSSQSGTSESTVYIHRNYTMQRTDNLFGNGNRGWIIKDKDSVSILGLQTNGNPWDNDVTAILPDSSIVSGISCNKIANSYFVEGSGTEAINGLYTFYDKDSNDKQIYKKVNYSQQSQSSESSIQEILSESSESSSSVNITNDYYILFNYNQWIISDQLNGSNILYYNEDEEITKGTWQNSKNNEITVKLYNKYMNLKEENIKSGITIDEFTGTFTNDADATENDILSGKTAYVNGQKITGTAILSDLAEDSDREKIYPLYITNGQYVDVPNRLFQADINISGSKITFPTPFRQSIYNSTGLIFNGNLYYHYSLLNNEVNNRSFQISGSDWNFITRNPDGANLVAIKGGKLAIIQTANNPESVSIVIPTNSLSGITQLARCYDCWVCIDKNNNPSMFSFSNESPFTLVTNNTASISKILNQYISDWDEGTGFRGCLAIDSNGSIVKVYTDPMEDFTSESVLYVDTYASAGNDPFLNFYYHNESTMDYFYAYCANFAIRSSGLWYKIGDGSWNQLSNAPSLLSGNMLGYAFSALREDGYNEETWEPIYSLDIQKVALHIDSSGRLWKLMVNMDMNGSFTGIGVTQIGSDTDWTYVNPVYGKNQSSIAQKGGKLYVLKSSNDNNFNFTYTEYYMNAPGKLIMHNSEGLWFAPNEKNYNVVYSGGIINEDQSSSESDTSNSTYF